MYRYLGFPWATCSVPYTESMLFGTLAENATVWLDDVNCSGDEPGIDTCTFVGPGTDDCTGGPLQVVCQSCEKCCLSYMY